MNTPTPEQIAAYRAWLTDALTHAGRAEEDAIYETGLAVLDEWEALNELMAKFAKLRGD